MSVSTGVRAAAGRVRVEPALRLVVDLRRAELVTRSDVVTLTPLAPYAGIGSGAPSSR